MVICQLNDEWFWSLTDEDSIHINSNTISGFSIVIMRGHCPQICYMIIEHLVVSMKHQTCTHTQKQNNKKIGKEYNKELKYCTE